MPSVGFGRENRSDATGFIRGIGLMRQDSRQPRADHPSGFIYTVGNE